MRHCAPTFFNYYTWKRNPTFAVSPSEEQKWIMNFYIKFGCIIKTTKETAANNQAFALSERQKTKAH